LDDASRVAAATVISVLIADDQAVVRAGLRLIVEAQEDLQVAGEAADGAAAVDAVRTLEPDVVLMDIRMPILDGIEATRQIVNGGTASRVLVLTTYGLDENVYDALAAGAFGFLVKTDSPERLVDAIRVVAAGDALLAPEITRRLIERVVAGSPPTRLSPKLAELTAREREVLTLLARGKTNTEIAGELFVSEGTVKTHVARVLSKLGLRDRTQAVVFAYEHGIVRPGMT
jgi:DNA-binding NarL/FixJ family response regulator